LGACDFATSYLPALLWFPNFPVAKRIVTCTFAIRSNPSIKMSVVSLLGVNVMNNPAKFTDKYLFEITFECLEQLEKGTYGCARAFLSSLASHRDRKPGQAAR